MQASSQCKRAGKLTKEMVPGSRYRWYVINTEFSDIRIGVIMVSYCTDQTYHTNYLFILAKIWSGLSPLKKSYDKFDLYSYMVIDYGTVGLMLCCIPVARTANTGARCDGKFIEAPSSYLVAYFPHALRYLSLYKPDSF